MKNKIMLTLMTVGGTLATFAEGESGNMDTTAASNMVQKIVNGLTNLLTTVTPYVTTLVLAGLAIWAAMVVIRVVKRAFSRTA